MNEDWEFSSLSIKKDTAAEFREIRDQREYSTDGLMRKMLAAYENRDEGQR